MCFDNEKIWENNGTKEIGLVTPTPGPLPDITWWAIGNLHHRTWNLLEEKLLHPKLKCYEMIKQISQAFRILIRFFSTWKSTVTDCRSTDQGYKLWPVFSEQESEKHVDFFRRDALFYHVIICISVWFRLIIIMSEYCVHGKGVQDYLVKIKCYLKRGNQQMMVQVFMYPGLSLKYLNIYIGN